MHETLTKFGYPATLIREFTHWALVAREKQVTLGSCVIIGKSEATALGQLPPETWAEFAMVTSQLEAVLQRAFGYDKINYLALMMVDPQVHFHVLPRYAAARDFAGHHFIDAAWPGPPDLQDVQLVTPAQLAEIQQAIRAAWTD